MQNSRWSLGWFCPCVPGGCFSYVNERFPSKDVWLDLILHIELHLNSCWNQKQSHLKECTYFVSRVAEIGVMHRPK